MTIPWWTHALVWSCIFLWHLLNFLLKSGLINRVPWKGSKMDLKKAWDPQALLDALKAAGHVDAEKLIGDELPVIFDWANSSISLEAGAYAAFIIPILAQLEAKAAEALKAKV